jgi:hypothetical protein
LLERDGYPAGVPCWVDTAQPDPEAAVSFYSGLFGWEFEDRMPADSPGRYFVAQLRGRDVAAVGSQPEGLPPTPAWNTYVWVDGADEAAAKAKDAGGLVLVEPFDVLDAGRMAMLADPEGAPFCVWQAEEHKGAQLVNEPGTWNFSELNTRDPDGAEAFYGALFGWELQTFDAGEGAFSFWRLPATATTSRSAIPTCAAARRRTARPRASRTPSPRSCPSPATAPRRTPPAHWSITFAVDDADAVADTAAKLGGKVLAPPFDAPYVRMTVVSDPQGAVFTASRYMPPT